MLPNILSLARHGRHLRRLIARQGHVSCTNHQRQIACTDRIVLARSQPSRRARSPLLCNSSRCRSALGGVSNAPSSVQEGGKQRYYCSNDEEQQQPEPEPEYLEIVMETADRMRSAVRNYVAKYSNEQHNYYNEDDGKTPCIQNQNPAPIKLVGILATNTTHPVTSEESCDIYENDTYGNERYSEQISASCCNDGIVYEPWRVPLTIEALERAIHHANERLDVHGILVFYPVSDGLLTEDDTTPTAADNIVTTSDSSSRSSSRRRTYKCQETGVYYRSRDDYFRDLVACHKDVEGYCRKGLRIQQPSSSVDTENKEDTTDSEHILKAEELGPIYPCTALAVYKIIESLSSSTSAVRHASESKQFENTTMTIINRSEVLGLPLATMLSNKGATVYSINIDSILQFLPNGKVKRMHANTTMEDCVGKSSVIVSGVPSNKFQVPTDWIPPAATIINVAAESNFDEETIDDAEGVTYVPHVGRVTVAALEYNLMQLHKNFHVK